MGGSAVLGSNLVDQLVPTVDGLRTSLLSMAGIRPFRAYTVLRTWSGERRGEGTASDVTTELTPPPRVLGALRRELAPAGLEEEGEIMLAEVSLTYTEAELAGPVLSASQEWFIKLTDGNGLAIGTRYYVVSAPPWPDREQGIGWEVKLRRGGVV